MTDNTRELFSRIEKLENENRRLRRWGGGLLGATLLVGVLGAAAPAVCKTVWAERLVLRDSGGRDRLLMDAYGSATPSITMKDERGKSVVSLSWKDGVLLDILDGKGRKSASVKIDRDGKTSVVREEKEGDLVGMAD